MKKRLFFLLIFLIILISRGSSTTVLIQGQVINDSLNHPVSGQVVYIFSDSIFFTYNRVVYTDNFGFFMDTIQNIPDSGIAIPFWVETFDPCGNQWLDTMVYSVNSPIFVEFHLCIPQNVFTCQASFSYEIDSLSPNTIYFFDKSTINPAGPPISTWYWDFGDGTSSTMQNPVHAFNSFGSYQVCLTIAIQDSSGFICTDDTCENLTLEPYFNLGGLVFAGNYPINNPEPTGDTGVAYLYRVGGGDIFPVDTMSFHQYGYYWFANIPEGDYLVKVHLTAASSRYKEYAQTYFPAEGRWQDGESIHLADSGVFNADIHLQPVSDISSGNGKIAGMTIYGDSYPVIDPYPYAEVKLFNQAQHLIAYTFSGAGGYFEFTNLPFGLYQLQVDATGMYTIPATAYLDEMLVFADSLRLPVFDRDITAIGDRVFSGEIQVVPNPFRESFTLRISAPKISRYTLHLYEPAGRLAYRRQLHPGMSDYQIEPSHLAPGFYLLVISDEFNQVIFTGKVIKI